MVERDILLAELTGGTVHIAHVSRGRVRGRGPARQGARRARHRRGDAAPPAADRRAGEGHREYDTATKMNPPLRAEADRQALARGPPRRHHRLHRHRPRAPHRRRQEGRVRPGRVRHRRPRDGGRPLPRPPGGRPASSTCARLVELLSSRPGRASSACPAAPSRPGAPADVTVLDLARQAHGRSRALPQQGAQHAVRRDGPSRAGPCSRSSGGRVACGTDLKRVAATDPVADYNRLVARRSGRGARAGAVAARRPSGARRSPSTAQPMPTLLRPHFVPQARLGRASRTAGRRLLELAARVARAGLRRRRRRGSAPTWARRTPKRAGCASIPASPTCVLSRLDAFLTAGGPRFIEINSDAPAGFGYGDRMAEVFRQLPGVPRLRPGAGASPTSPRAAPSSTRWSGRVATARPAPASPRIAIVDWADVKTRADQEILRRRFAAVGLRLRPRRSARR